MFRNLLRDLIYLHSSRHRRLIDQATFNRPCCSQICPWLGFVESSFCFFWGDFWCLKLLNLPPNKYFYHFSADFLPSCILRPKGLFCKASEASPIDEKTGRERSLSFFEFVFAALMVWGKLVTQPHPQSNATWPEHETTCGDSIRIHFEYLLFEWWTECICKFYWLPGNNKTATTMWENTMLIGHDAPPVWLLAFGLKISLSGTVKPLLATSMPRKPRKQEKKTYESYEIIQKTQTIKIWIKTIRNVQKGKTPFESTLKTTLNKATRKTPSPPGLPRKWPRRNGTHDSWAPKSPIVWSEPLFFFFFSWSVFLYSLFFLFF